MRLKGRRVLIIGDSLSYPGYSPAELTAPVAATSAPGVVMASDLLQLGASTVRIDAKVGRSAYSYITSEDGDSLLAQNKAWNPDIVIVFLGTNDAGYGRTTITSALSVIQTTFPSADVWAILPPGNANADAARLKKEGVVHEALVDVFGRKLIDGRNLATGVARSTDNIHFTKIGARDFGAKLAIALASTPSPWLLHAAVGVLGVTGVGLALVTFIRLRAKKQLK